jgi:hypothetical protein
MFGGSSVGCGLYRVLICGSKKCFWKRVLDNAKEEGFWFANVVFPSCLHRMNHDLRIITWDLKESLVGDEEIKVDTRGEANLGGNDLS